MTNLHHKINIRGNLDKLQRKGVILGDLTPMQFTIGIDKRLKEKIKELLKKSEK